MTLWHQPSVWEYNHTLMCVQYYMWLSTWGRTNLVNGMLYSTHTCSSAHSHILIAVTPHWVKTCLHILALACTLLFLHCFPLKHLSHLHFLPQSSLFLHHCPPSPAGWWWCSWLPPPANKEGQRCWLVIGRGCLVVLSPATVSLEKESPVFVFLTCNGTVTTAFYRIPFHSISQFPLELGWQAGNTHTFKYSSQLSAVFSGSSLRST